MPSTPQQILSARQGLPAEDIRVTKTKKALATALLSLLEKHSFQKISVADICQEALVGRSTFYAHFEDKYMLLRHCLQELQQQLQLSCHAEGTDLYQLLLSALQQLKERHKTLLNLLGGDQNRELLSMLQEHFMGGIVAHLERQQAVFPIPLQLVAMFYAGGIASMNMAWIKGGFEAPAEQLARSQVQLLSAVAPTEGTQILE